MTRQNRIQSILLRFDRMSDEQLGRLAPSQIEDYREAMIADFEARLAREPGRCAYRSFDGGIGNPRATLACN